VWQVGQDVGRVSTNRTAALGLQWATSVGVFVLNLGPDLKCPPQSRSWLSVAVLALLRNNPWNYY